MLQLIECTLKPEDDEILSKIERDMLTTDEYFIHSRELMSSLQRQSARTEIRTNNLSEKEIKRLNFYCYPAYTPEKPLYLSHKYDIITTLCNIRDEIKEGESYSPRKTENQKFLQDSVIFRFYVLCKEEGICLPEKLYLDEKQTFSSLKIKDFIIDEVVLEPKNAIKYNVPVVLGDYDNGKSIERGKVHFMKPSPIVTEIVGKLPYIRGKEENTERSVKIPLPEHFIDYLKITEDKERTITNNLN